jgi:hypothetical protein
MKTPIYSKFCTMKLNALIVMSLFFFSSSVFAKTKVEEDIFLLHGKVFEMDIREGGDISASKVQVVVYQDNEIYVAFYTNVAGQFEFKLPVGHNYELWFGGSAYVNKKVTVDASSLKARKGGYDVEIDMGLFRPQEGFTFPMLDQPYVKVVWDAEYKQLVPDMAYTEGRKKELDKAIKKLKKQKV